MGRMKKEKKNGNGREYIKLINPRIQFLKLCTRLYLYIESFIYVCYLLLDIYTDGSDMIIMNLKYLSIFLCVLYMIIIVFSYNIKESYGTLEEREIQLKYYNSLLYLLSGIILTFMADYYLLLKHEIFYGVLYFVGVQISYMIYIYSNFPSLSLGMELEKNKKDFKGYSKNKRKINIQALGVWWLILLGSLIFSSGIIVLNSLETTITFLEIILLMYVSLFVINISSCVIGWFRSKKITSVDGKDDIVPMVSKYIVMLCGLLLYFICDIMVAIYNVDMYLSNNAIPMVLTSIAEVGMWVFYLPGKVLICLSAYFTLRDNMKDTIKDNFTS